MRHPLFSCGAFAIALLALAGNAHAQRARENAVAEASDAFGTAVRREEIGLYSATNARGFSPSQAGNLRIDGWFGLLWSNHVTKSWKAHIRRATGGLLFGCTAWLALTGCALYYIGSQTWRSWISILHWSIGLGALAAFLLHLWTRTPRVE